MADIVRAILMAMVAFAVGLTIAAMWLLYINPGLKEAVGGI